MRWPLVAKIGVGLAVLTVVVGLVAALVAAFVVGPRDDDEGSGVTTTIASGVGVEWSSPRSG